MDCMLMQSSCTAAPPITLQGEHSQEHPYRCAAQSSRLRYAVMRVKNRTSIGQ